MFVNTILGEAMKKKFILLIILILCCITGVNAFETSADSSNPFNEFLAPTKGVDLYSGNAIYSQKLFTMSGRNGLDVTVAMYYSSNVYNNMRARNDITPTGWVGLGWRLGFGSILSKHKNTMKIIDDEYEYVSPTGDKERMIQKYDRDSKYENDEFFIKSNPYLKFRRDIGDQSGEKIVKGWIVTTTSGKTFKYGNLDFNDNRNATWFTFCWKGATSSAPIYNFGYVGNGTGGSPSQYGYKWDLSQIEDVFGNAVIFKYFKVDEGVTVYDENGSTWTSPVKYTKASYLHEIINPQGQKIVFNRGDKELKEFLDPFTFYTEDQNGQNNGDAFMELVETMFLKSIDIFNTNGLRMKRVELRYHDQNLTIPVPGISDNHYEKRVLKEIKYVEILEEGTPPPPESEDEDYYDVRFMYNTNNPQPPARSDTCHYGSLIKITSSSGGSTEFQYTKQELPNEDCTKNLFLEAGDPNDNTYGIGGTETAPFNNVRAAPSKLSEGIEYVIFGVGHQFSGITGIMWNGKSWEHPKFTYIDGNVADLKNWNGLGPDPALPHVGADFFLIQKADKWPKDPHHPWRQPPFNYQKLYVFDWDKEDKIWRYNRDIHYNNDSTKVFCGSDFFVAANRRHYKIFYREADIWKTKDGEVTNSSSGRIDRIEGTNDYFVIVWDNGGGEHRRDRFSVYNRCCNWDLTLQESFDSDSGLHVSPSVNFFVVANKKDVQPQFVNHEVLIYSWNGSEWYNTHYEVLTDDDGIEDPITDIPRNRVDIKCGRNFVSIGYDPCPHLQGQETDKIYPSRVKIYNWDGKIRRSGGTPKWLLKKEFEGPELINRNVGLDVNVADNLFTLSLGTKDNSIEWVPHVHVYKWDYSLSNGWDWKEQFIDIREGPTDKRRGPVKVAASSKYIIVMNGERFLPNAYFKGFSWNGTEFKHSFSKIDVSIADQLTYGQNGDGSIITTNYTAMGSGGALHKVGIYKRHQDNIHLPNFGFLVTKKIVKDGIKPSGITTKFTYPVNTQNFNSNTNSFKNGNVEVVVEGNKWGKTNSFYYNEFLNEDLDHYRMNGTNYRNDLFRYSNGTFKLISQDNLSFQIYKKDNEWPDDIYSQRIVENKNMVDFITTKTTYDYTGQSCIYPDVTGIPRIIREYNSDESILTSFNLFAHEVLNYSNKLDKNGQHMLIQPAMSLVLKESAVSKLPFCPYNTWFSTISKEHIRSAVVTTWSNAHNDQNIWAPYETYTWNVNCDNTGKPKSDFTMFDFTDIPSNAGNKWEFRSRITKLDKFGQAVETIVPNSIGTSNGTYNSIIHRYDLNVKMADIINSKFEECAVFTCDYDMKEDVGGKKYFDYENGWYKSNATNLKLTNDKKHFGDTCLHVKNCKGPMKKIHITPGKNYIFSSWIYPLATTPVTMEVEVHLDGNNDASYTIRKSIASMTSKWIYLEGKLTEDDLPGYDALNGDYIVLWVGSTGTVDCYVDDIRFYPADAFVKSYYYNSQWSQNIVTVNANNNPSKKVKYNGYRKPIEWYKMKHNNDDVLVMKKEYHRRGFE